MLILLHVFFWISKAGNQGFARTQALMQLLNKPVLTELSMAGGKLEALVLIGIFISDVIIHILNEQILQL